MQPDDGGHTPGERDAEGRIAEEAAGAFFQRVGEVLAKYNMRCGFEFLGPLQFRQGMPHPFIWQMNEMVEFAKDCGPSFGVVLDVWHWYHSGATLNDIRKAGNSRIVLVHLSDAARIPPQEVRDNARLLAGEGVIDQVGIFKYFEGDALGRERESGTPRPDTEGDVGGGRGQARFGVSPGHHAQGRNRRLTNCRDGGACAMVERAARGSRARLGTDRRKGHAVDRGVRARAKPRPCTASTLRARKIFAGGRRSGAPGRQKRPAFRRSPVSLPSQKTRDTLIFRESVCAVPPLHQ
jgi:hypothetical protein